jgi:multidrug efflux pump subunit AcrA (membrane-fusion protein)
MKNNIKFFSIFIFTALLLSSCSVFDTQSTPESTPVPVVEDSGSVISQGNLVPKDYMYLAFPSGGHIEEILVKQGDQVIQGQVLARLGDRQQYEANLTAAQLEVENAQQALDDLNKNSDIASANAWLALLDANQRIMDAEIAWNKVDTDEYQEKIDDAEIKVSDMQTALDDAQTEFDKYADLDPENPTRKSAETALNDAQNDFDNAVHERDLLIITLERAEANLQLAESMQAKAQIDYDSTRQGPYPDQLTIAQMNLDTALAHRASAQAALDNLDLKAPFDSTVVDVNISDGELVGSDKWAVLVADYSEWYVETNDLTEQEVVKVSIGQGASISPDALPDLQASGVVTEIADNFYVQAGDILYKVRLHVDQPDPGFRWGMTVEISFNP